MPKKHNNQHTHIHTVEILEGTAGGQKSHYEIADGKNSCVLFAFTPPL